MKTARETIEVQVTATDIWSVRNLTFSGSPVVVALRREGTVCNRAGGYTIEIDGVLWECDEATKIQEHAFRIGGKVFPFVARLIRKN